MTEGREGAEGRLKLPELVREMFFVVFPGFPFFSAGAESHSGPDDSGGDCSHKASLDFNSRYKSLSLSPSVPSH